MTNHERKLAEAFNRTRPPKIPDPRRVGTSEVTRELAAQWRQWTECRKRVGEVLDHEREDFDVYDWYRITEGKEK